MAGKKGRSGRKKKIVTVSQPAKPTTAGQKTTIEQPANDPFAGLESRLGSEIQKPVTEQPIGSTTNVQIGAEPQPAQAPENLVRMIWNMFYNVEDTIFRTNLGISDDYKGLFKPKENVLNDHATTTCKILEKRLPPGWLNNLSENAPEYAFLISFGEAQLGIFNLVAQAKREIEQGKKDTATPLATDKPKPDGGGPKFNYPQKGAV